METAIGQTISHYKILDKLGEGGMGVIYKAEDKKLKRTVALKVLPESFTQDPLSKKRFINEAQAASSLQHNNICTIHEIDETVDGELFIVMDYYEGETLKSKIKRECQLRVDEVLMIIEQISEGLDKAHESGIIHRDIKPANIFITKEGTVKILDFGLAKRKDQTLSTRIGTRFGTIDYMSPEQVKGEKVDLRTDIWSLGVMLYEMLTGEVPFHADYEQAMIYLILNQEPDDVRKYRNDIPEKLIGILEKSISKDKEDRYEDLSGLIEDLKNITKKEEKEKLQIPAPKHAQSIAVLPFVNMNNAPDQECFCDGLTEELISSLSRIRDLKVVARTSANAFKGSSYDVRKIGRKLDVRTVLEGSVRKEGSKLRITVQLINVLDGYHIWSERYDREAKDLFKIQDEITLAIIEVLKVKLLENEKEKMLKHYTDNVYAYNQCQQGLYFFNQFNFKIVDKAIEYFNKAIEMDPNYALAYYGAGTCYFCISYFGLKKTCEVKPFVEKYFKKALEIDENFCEGYDLLGLYYACFEWRWAVAEAAWKRSLELNPYCAGPLGNFAINRVSWSQFDLARKLIERAKAIDPLSDYVEVVASFPDFCSGKLDLVVERLSKYLKLDPPFWWGLWTLWRAYSLIGNKEKAVEACKKSYIVTERSFVADMMDKAGIDNAFSAAADCLAELYQKQYTSPYDIATLLMHAGRREEVFYWLNKSVEDIDQRIHFINVDPEWQTIHDDSRFIMILKVVGFIP